MIEIDPEALSESEVDVLMHKMNIQNEQILEFVDRDAGVRITVELRNI